MNMRSLCVKCSKFSVRVGLPSSSQPEIAASAPGIAMNSPSISPYPVRVALNVSCDLYTGNGSSRSLDLIMSQVLMSLLSAVRREHHPGPKSGSTSLEAASLITLTARITSHSRWATTSEASATRIYRPLRVRSLIFPGIANYSNVIHADLWAVASPTSP